MKQCLVCEEELVRRDQKKFCGHSCSAKYTNRARAKKNPCRNCGTQIAPGRLERKYCSEKCCAEYRFNESVNSKNPSSRTMKTFLIKEHGTSCMECGWNKINPTSNKVPIELEHIDGNSKNNKIDNLKLLCPNCHSLTPTYKALNKGNGRHERMTRYKNGLSY